MPRVALLDYGAGNVCSLRNALRKLGFEVDDVTTPEHIAAAGVLLPIPLGLLLGRVLGTTGLVTKLALRRA